jgi:hypothetical protein
LSSCKYSLRLFASVTKSEGIMRIVLPDYVAQTCQGKLIFPGNAQSAEQDDDNRKDPKVHDLYLEKPAP